ncbi:PQQ-binding-like beta-propeller repeat protein [Dactylosporangium sp. NPDC048998]|uniref:outer membrane protein assembly factor BamB family protein n=1 Tax=Dactylosporangium sp. NPDC048998 TaxID=3363976 RepID=UPI00371DD46D
MPPTAVIMLDTSEAWEPPDRPTRPRHASQRLPAIGLVLVTVFALVTGAQPVTPLTPSAVLRDDGISNIRSFGHDLYLIRQPDLTQAVLESYRMPDSARRWASRVDAHSQFVGLSDERVVLTVAGPNQDSTPTLVGLDAASGAQVWRRTGYKPSFYGLSGAPGVVLADPDTPGADDQQEQQRSDRQLVGIDARTGDIRWSFVTPAGSARSYEFSELGFAEYRVEIAELDPDGTLRVRSAESAEVVRTAKVDDPGHVGGFSISGDRLLTNGWGQTGQPGGAMFDLVTGRRLWERAAETAGGPIWWCGRMLLCAWGERTIAALDPDTGRELWRLDGWRSLEQIDDKHLLATLSAPNPDDPSLGGLVVDAATGRTVRRIVGWDPVGRQAAGPVLLVASRSLSGPSQVARLNLDTGALTVFGTAEHWYIAPKCVTMPTVLVCQHGRVSVWPLPA